MTTSNLIIIFMAICIGTLAGISIFYWRKFRKTKLDRDNIDTSLFLYEITFSEDGFMEKLKKISLAIMKRLHFDYVSFFIVDHKKNVGIISSTVPEYDKPELISYARELLTKADAQIHFSETGYLPHGQDRYIKYSYFIPLQEKGTTIGGILLEKDSLENIDLIENMVFETIIKTVRKAFSFIIFAYNLNESAYKDALTGVLNRAALDTIDETLSSTHTAVMVDIDHFKQVNDTYGHDAGDEIIKHLASTLQQNIRPDDLVIRMGGEEFLMLLKDTDANAIIGRINNVRRVIENYVFKYGDKEIRITSSFGLCDTSQSNNLHELIKASDQALYYSKNNGRNRATIYRNGM